MKKYVVGLLLLFMRNVSSMEFDPLAMMLKNEEKCKLVAKYVHKYPKGEAGEEAHKIKLFLNDITSGRAVLSQCVNKYKNMLQNMEAEEVLHDMHTIDLPFEIKQNIFARALWNYAAQYYVIYNTCKFVAMDSYLIPDGVRNWPYMYCAPCFLAELSENNDQYIFFSKIKLESSVEMHEINKQRMQLSDCDDSDGSYGSYPNAEGFCYVKSIYCKTWQRVGFQRRKKKIVKDLVVFLEAKKFRVLAFKQLFDESIQSLLQKNGKEGVNTFIELLVLYKDLPKTIASMYETDMHTPASEMLQNLSRMYEREENKFAY